MTIETDMGMIARTRARLDQLVAHLDEGGEFSAENVLELIAVAQDLGNRLERAVGKGWKSVNVKDSQMKESLTERLRGADGVSVGDRVDAADLIERAYGLLWRETSFQGPATRAARKLLLGALSKGGQRRGIEYAIREFGAVTYDEALRNFP